MPLNSKAKAFIVTVVALAAACFFIAATHSHSNDILHFLCYLAVALLASAMKVSLPGIDGTLSVNFIFILLGVMEMSFAETLVLGSAAVLVQCYWKPTKRLVPIHIIFNLAQLTVASAAAYAVYHVASAAVFRGRQPLALMASAIAYFLFNTIAMSLVISLTEQKQTTRVWKEAYIWLFPYYLMGAGFAESVGLLDKIIGWQTSLLVMPAVYVIYRSYRLYFAKLENEKKRVEIAGLHLRTIEALALAIEAKDHNTHEHLQRVCVYAMELAEDLNLKQEEKEALRAAALLHDIGKLAVPEHIISKPGKLSPEEFEKMKIHPIIGAEILERVQFPYPVVPIVRSHHEKWDGSGYPDGLKGEQIPIGARILSAVDCLDALSSDRPYRRAFPLGEAMLRVVAEAGKAFDPEVVNTLHRRYKELEQMANEQPPDNRVKLSTDLKVGRCDAPAAGFAREASQPSLPDFSSSIAAARQEGQMLLELSNDLGNSLSLEETLSILSLRLKKLVPYQTIAIYLQRDKNLHPEFVSGDDSQLFSTLEIPLGHGLSGWVAQNRKPILNGNPSVELGYLKDPTKVSTMRSALAVPLECTSGVLGVLALHCAGADAFTSDHLRILLAISSKLGLVIENTLKYRNIETCATVDSLTGLFNSRSLFLHLEKEMGRCRREKLPLSVLVCDLDGFKKVNDRFGHMEGNRLLRAFADGLKKSCRDYDCVARMGGDEFVIVAPGRSARAACEIMKRIVACAGDAGRLVCNEDIISASVGIAFFSGEGETAEELLTEADRRMYRAKQKHHLQAAEDQPQKWAGRV